MYLFCLACLYMHWQADLLVGGSVVRWLMGSNLVVGLLLDE